MLNWKKIIGNRYGRLIALCRCDDYITPKGARYPRALFKCDCGTEKPIIVYSVLNGVVTSCGCKHKEFVKQLGHNNKKYNTYDLTGEYGIGYDYNNNEFYFDLEDYDLIKNYCWSLDSNNGYIKTIYNNKKLYLHRLLMNCNYNDGTIVDHINRIRIDCRKNNLRFIDASNNVVNQNIRIDNKSGVTGVYFDKKRNKWESYVKINHKKVSLGFYVDFNDAVKSRIEAAKKYYGEYSPQKDIDTL